MAVEASSQIIKGTVLVNGSPATAEYMVLSDGTVGLGTGRNASISHYTVGRVTVPSTVKSGDKTYRVTQVMPMAFRLCNDIHFVSIPEGVTRIGNFAFVGCKSLREVKLPSTLKSVGSGAFANTQLHYVSCAAQTPPEWEYNDVFFIHSINDNTPHQFPEDTRLAVPEGTVEAYRKSKFSDEKRGWKTAEGWGTAFQVIENGIHERFGVYNLFDLNLLNDLINKGSDEVKFIYIEADLDMEGKEFVMLGNDDNHHLRAKVDGMGHTISNITYSSDEVAGLFGYYDGPSITNIRLKNCNFIGRGAVGAIAAVTTNCRIDSVKTTHVTVHGDGHVGNLVGVALEKISMDRCAVMEGFTHTQTAGFTPKKGGLIGSAENATITNCAVQSSNLGDGALTPFVGYGHATIDYAYAICPDLTGYTPPVGIDIGKHVIYSGQAESFLDMIGIKHNFNYESEFFKNVFPAAILGFDAWAYAKGRYPMPDCLTYDWEQKPNMAIYGSASMAKTGINVLTPDEDIPASAWLDLTEVGYRHYRFKASQLWIDRNLSVLYNPEQLPLGLSRQIIAEQGIIYRDTIYAERLGSVPVKQPVYKMNEQNKPEYDDNGNMICVDSIYLYDKILWKENVHPLCLPYNVALPNNCTLYQPTDIYDVNGETTALFERVRENFVEAFRPYLLVVKGDSVPLGTLARTVCPQSANMTMRFGDYEYAGTMSRHPNSYARNNNIYFIEDERHWRLAKQYTGMTNPVEPFTAYFQAKGDTPATRIAITLDDNNPVISVGDFYFTINTENTETQGNVTATLSGYHGRGGNVVVPATAPYVHYGQKIEVPVTNLAPDIFVKNTAQLWSIDFTQCKDMPAVTVDRTKQGNPFYKVDERTVIYLPEGKGKPGKNVVAGTECQSVTITDNWDFRPPYDFHADEAEYSRILYATKLKNGTYQSYAYTVCLPFSMSQEDMYAADPDINTSFYAMAYVNQDEPRAFVFSNHLGNLADSPYPMAGYPYIVVVREGSFQFKAHDVMVIGFPNENECPVYLYDDSDVDTGNFKGTFSRISNEDAAAINAYSLNKGTWCRILSDEGSHRGAYISAFRAYFSPIAPLPFQNYKSDYVAEPQGDDDDNPLIYFDFPADDYVIDTDFTGYEDVIVGIQTIHDTPLSILNSNTWYTIDGRHVNGVPTEKGIYVNRGRKIVIK